MKLKQISLILTALMLVGCSTKSSSSNSDSSSANPSSDGSSGTGILQEWPDDVSTNMKTLLGEELAVPDIPTAVKLTDMSDEENHYVEVVFDSTENYMEEYATVLESEGFTITTNGETQEGYVVSGTTVTEETCEFTIYELEKGPIYVALTVSEKRVAQLGSDEETYYVVAEPGNDIYAFSYLLQGSTSVWPADEIKEYTGLDIPSPEAVSYEIVDLSAYGYGIYAYAYTDDTNIETNYKEKLENAKFTVAYSEANEMYVATNESEDLLIGFYYEKDEYCFTIILKLEPVEWPADEIAELFDGAVVPSFPGVSEYYVDSSDLENYGYVITFDATDLEDPETTYEATLTEAGFTIEYDEDWEGNLAYSADKKVIVGAYLYDDTFYIQIFGVEEVVIEENALDFSTETLLTTKGDDESVWENGEYKMVVTKGTSSQNVGNTNYYADPLRLYAGQHVVLTWGSNEVTTITINCNTSAAKSNVENAIDFVGGTATVDGDIITVTIAEGATEVSFDIGSVAQTQLHIDSIVFNA